MIKRFLVTIISVSLVGMSVAFLMRAAIGIGPYDAFTQSFANLLNIKIGNMTIIINGIFLIIQLFLLGKKFPKTQYLQILVILSIGSIINLFYYNVLNFELSTYLYRFIFFITGIVISAFGVAAIMNMNFVFTPLEGLINALSKTFDGDFVKYRWGFDIFCIFVSLIFSFIFSQNILVREGTILSFLLFSPLLGYFMKLQKPVFVKYGLLKK